MRIVSDSIYDCRFSILKSGIAWSITQERKHKIYTALTTGRAIDGAHVPSTKVFRRLIASVNETIVKPRLAAVTNTYTSDFPDV